jgi:hypothetical protein
LGNTRGSCQDQGHQDLSLCHVTPSHHAGLISAGPLPAA